MNVLYRLATLLLILAIPVLLVATSIRWVINEPRLYAFEFERHDVTDDTGIAPDQLEEAARQIRAYFNSDQESLDVRVEVNGVERSLYRSREVLHMRDVKALVRGVYLAQAVMGVFLVVAVVVALAVGRWRGGRWVAHWLWRGALLTGGLVLATGLVSAVAWPVVFRLFHELSFTNNLWQLSRNDYLILMFPTEFFLETTLLIGLATVAEALALGAVVWSVQRTVLAVREREEGAELGYVR